MRADRLIAALLVLQARGRVTAAELAGELEVSVATARRDLAALSTAGVPVYPLPGRGGGWELVGGARTDLTGLSAPEARALFLLLGPAAAGGEAAAALRKLLRALPSTFRADAEAAATATVVDPTGWGGRDRGRPDLVDLLQSAVVSQRKVRLAYTNRARERTERLVDPWGLVDKDEVWYLVAGTERGRRTFRVDRIEAAELTDLAAPRPDGFRLAAAWREVVGEVEARRSRTWATLLIESRFLPVLRDQFGQHCHAGDELGDGWVRVRVGAPTARDIARQLAGWGAGVEVLAPASVRAELARIGAELAAGYIRADTIVPDQYGAGMEQRISLITLGVADVARARTFYERLGWRGQEVEQTVFFQAGGIAVVLWGRDKLAADAGVADPGGGGFGGVALAHNVRSRSEVDAVLDAAAQAGAEVTQPARETFYGGYAGCFTDLDGHVWEIAYNPGFPLGQDGTITVPSLTAPP